MVLGRVFPVVSESAGVSELIELLFSRETYDLLGKLPDCQRCPDCVGDESSVGKIKCR